MSDQHFTTIQKCQKIINFYDDIEPRNHCARPFSNTKTKTPYHLPRHSSSKSSSSIKRDFSFSKHPKGNQNASMSSNSSASKHFQQKNLSFVSAYNRESRFDKIMKLKVKPTCNHVLKDHEKTKKSVLNSSLSSMNSSRSRSQANKENCIKNKKESRLDKIMKIKVVKPKINSTLVNYEPVTASKSIQKQRKQSKIKQWKESIQKIRKVKQQEDKEDRLWKVFERERQLRLKLKKDTSDREAKEKRRKEKRFETMVSNEIGRIQNERQKVKRKTEGFTKYVYPSY